MVLFVWRDLIAAAGSCRFGHTLPRTGKNEKEAQFHVSSYTILWEAIAQQHITLRIARRRLSCTPYIQIWLTADPGSLPHNRKGQGVGWLLAVPTSFRDSRISLTDMLRSSTYRVGAQDPLATSTTSASSVRAYQRMPDKARILFRVRKVLA